MGEYLSDIDADEKDDDSYLFDLESWVCSLILSLIYYFYNL